MYPQTTPLAANTSRVTHGGGGEGSGEPEPVGAVSGEGVGGGEGNTKIRVSVITPPTAPIAKSNCNTHHKTQCWTTTKTVKRFNSSEQQTFVSEKVLELFGFHINRNTAMLKHVKVARV
jgi:hypothetical protein